MNWQDVVIYGAAIPGISLIVWKLVDGICGYKKVKCQAKCQEKIEITKSNNEKEIALARLAADKELKNSQTIKETSIQTKIAEEFENFKPWLKELLTEIK